MTQRFRTILDCVTTGFLPDGTLDALPLPVRAGQTQVGGIDRDCETLRVGMRALSADLGITASSAAA